MKKKKGKKKFQTNSMSKLSLFQKSEMRMGRTCPLSKKDAPIIDYKNIKLLKRYISEFDKILPTKITSVSQNKQRKLSNEIKKARTLGLI